jgi:hypothetical protein
MANTRNCGANENNNNNANLPPPPTLEQVLKMQAQMLQTLSYICSKLKGISQRHNPNPVTNLESFSGPNLLYSLTLSSQWMPMIG